jgi:hypothetical protein
VAPFGQVNWLSCNSLMVPRGSITRRDQGVNLQFSSLSSELNFASIRGVVGGSVSGKPKLR